MYDNKYKNRFLILKNIMYTCNLSIDSYNTPVFQEYLIDLNTGDIHYSWINIKFSLYEEYLSCNNYLKAILYFIKLIDFSYDSLKEDFNNNNNNNNLNSKSYIEYLYHELYSTVKIIFKHDLDEDDLWD